MQVRTICMAVFRRFGELEVFALVDSGRGAPCLGPLNARKIPNVDDWYHDEESRQF